MLEKGAIRPETMPRSRLSRPKTLGSVSLSVGFAASIARMAASISTPISGDFEIAERRDQRTGSGAQKTLPARYSSGSSGSA
jgi:hypothetical protein